MFAVVRQGRHIAVCISQIYLESRTKIREFEYDTRNNSPIMLSISFVVYRRYFAVFSSLVSVSYSRGSYTYFKLFDTSYPIRLSAIEDYPFIYLLTTAPCLEKVSQMFPSTTLSVVYKLPLHLER